LVLAPYGVAMGTGILVLELFLCVAYLKYYKSVFTVNPTL
jgi:hypothetical protein